MPRPINPRNVFKIPSVTTFTPGGVNACGEIVITLDQYEAVRLFDVEGMDQESAAKFMGVSRQTFGRILSSARSSIATFIVGGFSLRIEGGNYSITEKEIDQPRGECLKRGRHRKRRGTL